MRKFILSLTTLLLIFTLFPGQSMAGRLFDDASSQYMRNTSAVPVSAAPFTISVWFNSDDATINQGLVSIGVSGSGDNRWTLSANGAGVGDPIAFNARTTTNALATSSSGFTAGTWHHALAVEVAADNHRVYIDGGGEGTSTTSRTPSGVDTFLVGALHGAGAVSGHFSGKIGEVAVWNVALNAMERIALANGASALTIRPDALVRYIPAFGLESPEPAFDTTGTIANSELTLVAGPTLAPHPSIGGFLMEF